MRPFNTLSTHALLESLIDYYHRYRKAVRETLDEREYIICNLAIRCIHGELERRGITPRGKIHNNGDIRQSLKEN